MTESISGRYAFVVNYLVVFFSLDHVQSANTTGAQDEILDAVKKSTGHDLLYLQVVMRLNRINVSLQARRWWASPCITSPTTRGLASSSTWRISTWWSPTEVQQSLSLLRSFFSTNELSLISPPLSPPPPGLGIGSDILRHLSDVSTEP